MTEGFFAIEVIASATSPDTTYALAWRVNEDTVQTYATWAAAIFDNYEQFTAPDIAEAGDPDNDGVENLLEYALNGSPMQLSIADLPSVALVDNAGDDNLTLTYKVRNAATDLTYSVQWSTDLLTWDTTNIIEDTNVPTGDGITNTVTSRWNQDLTAVGGKAFLRLRVDAL